MEVERNKKRLREDIHCSHCLGIWPKWQEFYQGHDQCGQDS